MADQEGAGAPAVDQLLDSTLESVDQAEEAVLREAREAGFEEDDLHKIGIAVRECMVNAVVHGNRYSAKKKVRVRVSRGPGRLEIIVADQGGHFDVSRLPDPLAEENLLRDSGRGLLLMQAFMDEFQVRPLDPQGTEVRMVKYTARAGEGGVT
jgi:serine/threonine-protein kinase RsbW